MLAQELTHWYQRHWHECYTVQRFAEMHLYTAVFALTKYVSFGLGHHSKLLYDTYYLSVLVF